MQTPPLTGLASAPVHPNAHADERQDRPTVRLRQLMRPLCLVFAAIWLAPASAEEIFQRETVDGVVVWLQITPSRPHSSTSKEESDHRIVAMLREQATGRAIEDASVTVEVAKKGRVATHWPLAPSVHGPDPAYVGQVPMAGRGTAYRIRLQFRRPGDREAFETEFRYAHH